MYSIFLLPACPVSYTHLYEICEKEEEADALFLNTCSIRENAENKIYHRLDTLHAEQNKGRKVILGVLGCMACLLYTSMVSWAATPRYL